MKNMKNLNEELLQEMNRVRELIKIYEELPDNAGFLGASLMKVEIKRAEKAIAEENVVEETIAFEELKKCTG